MGDQMIGIFTAGPYSAAHDSAMNKSYVAAIKQANGFLPNIISLGAYDGMHLLYEALKKTSGNTDGDALIDCHEGHELGESTRSYFYRSRDPGHRQQYLYPQSREVEWAALEYRI